MNEQTPGRAILPSRNNFRETIDGKQTDLYILRNLTMEAAITNYGGRIVSLIMPDKEGKETDVVIGFNSIREYQQSAEPYYGATIGRFANRIAKGRFTLDGKEYVLATNNGANHLHGGKKGFQYVVWDAEQRDDTTLILTYQAADGEEGYPGNLQARVVFTLTQKNELKIDFEATTDAPTIINLTNHAYFNLNGEGSGPITEHKVTINADHYTPIDEGSIPLGAIDKVEGTPFDFREGKTIGASINEDHQQLKNGCGYDHNFVLSRPDDREYFHAATALGNKSGILMDVHTQEPGMQLYTGNFMDGSHKLKNGSADDYRTAFCFETQHFPDSPNQPHFPSTVLRPGETYKTSTIFWFT